MTFEQVQHEKDFIQNWLSDLLDAMEAELDQPTLNRLVGACGRGCFLRHAFKREMAVEGKGSLEKLISAMQNNFEVWLAEDGVHIRYGETVERCYCPVAPAGSPRRIALSMHARHAPVHFRDRPRTPGAGGDHRDPAPGRRNLSLCGKGLGSKFRIIGNTIQDNPLGWQDNLENPALHLWITQINGY
jgi:hypothetical protein